MWEFANILLLVTIDTKDNRIRRKKKYSWAADFHELSHISPSLIVIAMGFLKSPILCKVLKYAKIYDISTYKNPGKWAGK